jgi:leucyl-tRNA synthetase
MDLQASGDQHHAGICRKQLVFSPVHGPQCETFCSRSASDYWGQVDLYIGGTEHAVGHLLYSRMWTKFLFDLGLIGFDEPYLRLVNRGMIQGSSRFVYRIEINGPDEMEALAKQKPVLFLPVSKTSLYLIYKNP